MPKLILPCLLFLCATRCFAQSGQLDPSFGNHGIVATNLGAPYDNNSAARQVIVQPDGTIYIVFDFPTYISKRLPNGSIDSSYGFYGYSKSMPFNDAYAALQPDGKIVIAGSGFTMARLNSNGSLDSTFGSNGLLTAAFNSNSNASAVSIQGDGKIVVAGVYNIGDTYFAVTRLNTNGSPDNTFNGNGQVLTDFGFKIPPQMKGETDSIPIHEETATTMGIQDDGKIVVGGYASNGNDGDFAIVRYNINGSLDSTFDNDGRQTTNFGDYDNAYALVIQNDGKILLAGSSVAPNTNFGIVRYNPNGSLDSSFNGNGKQTANLIVAFETGNTILTLQADGKIVVAGYSSAGPDNNNFEVIRYDSNGSPDNTFDGDGVLTTDFASSDDYAGSVAIQNGNKIVVAGYSNRYSPNFSEHFDVARYNPDGTPDNSFADNGKLTGVSIQGNTTFFCSAFQNDGKVIAAGVTWNGTDNDFGVARYNTNGNIDSSFNGNGKQIIDFGSENDNASSVAVQADGKILIAGYSYNDTSSRFAIVRYNTDGTPDNSFNSNGKSIVPNSSIGSFDVCRSMAIQNDGKIVLAGYAYNGNFDSVYFAIARLNTDGTLDNSFDRDGWQQNVFNAPTDAGEGVVIQNDGKIVVSGYDYVDGVNHFVIARYNPDGSLDKSFADNGARADQFETDSYYQGTCLALQTDGKIVVGGYGASIPPFNGTYKFVLARYKTNGDPDSTFNGVGFQSTYVGAGINGVTSVAVNADGKIALGGATGDYAIVMYNRDGSLDNNFGNNGIQTTAIGMAGSSLRSIAFRDNKLYATGYAQFPGNLGVIARYALAEGGPLPVRLLDFTGVLQSKSVLLKWSIATEKNITGFVIERSADGNRFLPINNLQVNGPGTYTRNYSITDAQPLQGVNFYRLKIFDIDGKSTYSNIVAVKISTDNKLQIFPNPVNRILFAQATRDNENAILQIIDEGGRKLKEMKIFLNGTTSFSIDVSTLPRGIYNLILTGAEKTEVTRFIKR